MQPLNLVGNFQSGFQNALAGGQAVQQMNAQRAEMQRAQEQRNWLAQNGAALAQGDQNALAGYAQFDPTGAFNMGRQVQADRRAESQFGQQTELNDARLQQIRTQMAQATAEEARRMSAEEAAAEAAEANRMLGEAAAIYETQPDAIPQWAQANAERLQEAGIDPASVTVETFPAIIAGIRGAQEGLEAAIETAQQYGGRVDEPATIQALRIRAQEAGLQPGTEAYQQFMQTGGRPSNGMAIRTTPDGGIEFVQGDAAGGDFKFTETQSKDNVFATRARGALEAFEPVANTLTDRMDRAAEYVPFGLARGTQSEDFQVAQQTGTEFLQAILRKDTGAAITQDETDSYGRVYLPMPGDGPAVLEAKKEARIRAINAIESGMSPAQMLVRDRALVKSAQEAGGGGAQAPTPEDNPFAGMSREELATFDVGQLETLEELRAFRAAMEAARGE